MLCCTLYTTMKEMLFDSGTSQNRTLSYTRQMLVYLYTTMKEMLFDSETSQNRTPNTGQMFVFLYTTMKEIQLILILIFCGWFSYHKLEIFMF